MWTPSPREASTLLVLDPSQVAAVKPSIGWHEARWKAAQGAFDPGLHRMLEPAQADRVMATAKAEAVIRLLLPLPYGVEAMGPNAPGMEMASIGPDMWDVPTQDEPVSIPSAGRFWTLVGRDFRKGMMRATGEKGGGGHGVRRGSAVGQPVRSPGWAVARGPRVWCHSSRVSSLTTRKRARLD